MTAPTLAHHADCQSCDWTADADTWAALDKAAERHARTGHVVVSLTAPGKP